MTAPCCKKCKYATRNGNCRSVGTECSRWRGWFRKEWVKIQRAAQKLRKANEEADEHDQGRT